MALQVDTNASSNTPPTSTGGMYTYNNQGQMVYVPKPVVPLKPVVPVTQPPKKPVLPTPIKPSNPVLTDTGTGGNNYVPPPPAAKPLDMQDYAAFEQQDSAASNQVVKPPASLQVPDYVPGKKPTAEELAWILNDLRAHAADMWKYAGPKEVGITPADAARIKSQIPFSEVMPVEAPKIDFYSGVDAYTGLPYGVTPPTPAPQGPNTTQTPTEEPTLSIEEPTLPPITWEEKYQVEGAPDWWRGFIPSRNDPQSEYASLLNSMIPYMSPEDQRYTASVLYRLYPETFTSYNPETMGMPPIPTDMTTDINRWMTSLDRANALLATLDKVKAVSASDAKFGPGYAYLNQLGSVLRDFGAAAGNGQTRTQYRQMMSALDPLMAETKQEDLSAYSTLTRMLAQPYYSAGSVTPTTQLQSGETIFGQANKGWF